MSGAPTHGHTRGRAISPEYMSWLAMRNRCHYPKNEKFATYGARGIVVCDRWRHSFENFLADMGPRPDGTTIDRIDNAKGYEPGNCRWATPTEQSANRRPFANRNARKTACPRGHVYDRTTASGWRRCTQCDSERRRARRRGEAA